MRDFVKRWTEWLRSRGIVVRILVGTASVVFLAAVIVGAYLLYRAI